MTIDAFLDRLRACRILHLSFTVRGITGQITRARRRGPSWRELDICLGNRIACRQGGRAGFSRTGSVGMYARDVRAGEFIHEDRE
jgi:hypothetical protein